MAKRRLSQAAIIIAVIILVGHWGKHTFSAPFVSQQSATEDRIVASSNQLGFDLLKAINGVEGDDDLFISPLSIWVALALATNGARGTTQNEILETLHLADLTMEDLQTTYLPLATNLVARDTAVQVGIANSAWYRLGFDVKQDFLDECAGYYDADIFGLDFNRPDAPDSINEWISQKTAGKIDEIIQYIDPLTMMFLINALYFNATWTDKFDTLETIESHFHSLSKDIECQFMVKDARFPYYENEFFQAVDLPYGDGDYCMTILLPQEDVSVGEVLQLLSTETWGQWMSEMVDSMGHVMIPRFNMNYEVGLKQLLTDLGMELAFDRDHADFTGITTSMPLWIDEIKHCTAIGVNEQGTEAAAVTIVILAGDSGDPFPGFTMYVDRPFFFAIRDKVTGTLLFLGTVVEPTSNVSLGPSGIFDTGDNQDGERALDFALEQNYPNPFNSRTKIRFALPVETDWQVHIYNIVGQLIQEYVGHSGAGYVTLHWDAADAASGIYFYRVTAGNHTATKKMTLVK